MYTMQSSIQFAHAYGKLIKRNRLHSNQIVAQINMHNANISKILLLFIVFYSFLFLKNPARLIY